MKLKEMVRVLKEAESFNDFCKKYADAYMCAVFLILDEKKEQCQIDFFIPCLEKIASFEQPFESFKIYEDKIKKMQELNIKDMEVDIENLAEVVEKEKKLNNINQKTTKIIAILKEDFWDLTCLDDFLGMLRIKVNAQTGFTKGFEKSSLIDFMSVKKIK